MTATRSRLLVVLAALLALPATALADARDYPGRLGDGPRVRGSGRTDGRGFGHDHGHRHFNRRPPVVIVPSYVGIGPSEAYAAPPPAVYSPPQVIYAPPVYYAPPPPAPSYAAPAPPAPTAPPEPTVVEFDTGRYELRGDGIREPHVWVWVPKPPAAPPGVATAPRQPATVYRWTDERGVVTLTDDPAKVPPQFRATDITPR